MIQVALSTLMLKEGPSLLSAHKCYPYPVQSNSPAPRALLLPQTCPQARPDCCEGPAGKRVIVRWYGGVDQSERARILVIVSATSTEGKRRNRCYVILDTLDLLHNKHERSQYSTTRSQIQNSMLLVRWRCDQIQSHVCVSIYRYLS